MKTAGLVLIVFFLIIFSSFGSNLESFIVFFFTNSMALSLSGFKQSMKAYGGLAVRQELGRRFGIISF
jgi:hypothetical protein